MIDIVSANSLGLGLFDTDIERAANLCATQIGSLEYEQEFGIDLAYFLQEDFLFQNESFQSYLIQRMAEYAINVTAINETLDSLSKTLSFSIGSQSTGGGLVAG